MPNPIPDLAEIGPNQVDHGLSGWTEQLPRKTQAYRSLQHQISQLVVTETSADGTVQVSVDSRGVPTELILTDRAQGVDPARLSAELMSCLRRAHNTLAGRVSNLVTSSAPNSGDDDDPSVSSLLC
ncbi:MAG: YbaB/EbfC family nucleoid-associated protein [Pseudonocardiaceae bacterium]